MDVIHQSWCDGTEWCNERRLGPGRRLLLERRHAGTATMDRRRRRRRSMTDRRLSVLDGAAGVEDNDADVDSLGNGAAQGSRSSAKCGVSLPSLDNSQNKHTTTAPSSKRVAHQRTTLLDVRRLTTTSTLFKNPIVEPDRTPTRASRERSKFGRIE